MDPLGLCAGKRTHVPLPFEGSCLKTASSRISVQNLRKPPVVDAENVRG